MNTNKMMTVQMTAKEYDAFKERRNEGVKEQPGMDHLPKNIHALMAKVVNSLEDSPKKQEQFIETLDNVLSDNTMSDEERIKASFKVLNNFAGDGNEVSHYATQNYDDNEGDDSAVKGNRKKSSRKSKSGNESNSGNGIDTQKIDQFADSIGDVTVALDDQGDAAKLSGLSADLRIALAQNNLSPEALTAVANSITEIGQDVNDQELAGQLDTISSNIRAYADEIKNGTQDRGAATAGNEPVPIEVFDNVADIMGKLANKEEDQEVAAALNNAEEMLREKLDSGDPIDGEFIDVLIDQFDGLDSKLVNQVIGVLENLKDGLAGNGTDATVDEAAVNEKFEDIANLFNTFSEKVNDKEFSKALSDAETLILDKLESGEMIDADFVRGEIIPLLENSDDDLAKEMVADLKNIAEELEG